MPSISPSGKTVLIADDSAAQRRFLEILFNLDGHKVVSFENGYEVLDYVQNHRPDLIVLDVHMPYMNGTEVCQNIKDDARLRNIPVILLSSLTDTMTEEMIYSAAADAFLQKPLIGKGFRRLVQDYLGQTDAMVLRTIF